jgi:signal transduction histidine kinase
VKRLQLLVVVFALALALPLTFVVWRTYSGLAQEESARLQYFARTIFDAMESDLTTLVMREENRAVDEYNYTFTPPGSSDGSQIRSPLSRPPQEAFILGYLQNNPDGSFQTPLAPDDRRTDPAFRAQVQQLEAINRIFNRKKTTGAVRRSRQPKPQVTAAKEKKPAVGFADRFVVPERTNTQRSYLGRKAKRVEEITAGQAQNLARQERQAVQAPSAAPRPPDDLAAADEARASRPASDYETPAGTTSGTAAVVPESETAAADAFGPGRFQVEVAPLQSVFIDAQQVFLFRRIVIDERIYRQGFVIRTDLLLKHLAASRFQAQPMADFAGLRLTAADDGRPGQSLQVGAEVARPRVEVRQTFPAPFDFLRASIKSEEIPASGSRRVLNGMLALLAAVFLVGFGALFHSARTLMDLAERRARFVSSVTHELKTPLTNIRMYIEMLEQGIARDTDREQAYFEILNSESDRLSRLINNVLELSRLEKNQRTLEMTMGTFEEVLEAVQSVMAAKLAREGFAFAIEASPIPPCAYDREAMIQVLINLVENSVKFGRRRDRRKIIVRVAPADGHVEIAVSDTGPGIPRGALKKIFDDFYRVEDALTRSTGGTGIGLALVRKFMAAMGGTVSAVNNKGPGCTITLRLPHS